MKFCHFFWNSFFYFSFEISLEKNLKKCTSCIASCLICKICDKTSYFWQFGILHWWLQLAKRKHQVPFDLIMMAPTLGCKRIGRIISLHCHAFESELCCVQCSLEPPPICVNGAWHNWMLFDTSAIKGPRPKNHCWSSHAFAFK